MFWTVYEKTFPKTEYALFLQQANVWSRASNRAKTFCRAKASDTGLGKEHIGLCSGEDGRWRENICFVMG